MVANFCLTLFDKCCYCLWLLVEKFPPAAGGGGGWPSTRGAWVEISISKGHVKVDRLLRASMTPRLWAKLHPQCSYLISSNTMQSKQTCPLSILKHSNACVFRYHHEAITSAAITTWPSHDFAQWLCNGSQWQWQWVTHANYPQTNQYCPLLSLTFPLKQ